MADVTPTYAASASITIAMQNVASSTTRTAGVESDVVDNRTTKYSQVWVSVRWTAGGTITVGRQIDVWAYAPLSDDLASSVIYPDVLDGTGSAETITSENVRNCAMKLLGSIITDNVAARTYDLLKVPLAAAFDGFIPPRWGIFVAHDSGSNSDTNAANFFAKFEGVKPNVT